MITSLKRLTALVVEDRLEKDIGALLMGVLIIVLILTSNIAHAKMEPLENEELRSVSGALNLGFNLQFNRNSSNSEFVFEDLEGNSSFGGAQLVFGNFEGSIDLGKSVPGSDLEIDVEGSGSGPEFVNISLDSSDVLAVGTNSDLTVEDSVGNTNNIVDELYFFNPSTAGTTDPARFNLTGDLRVFALN